MIIFQEFFDNPMGEEHTGQKVIGGYFIVSILACFLDALASLDLKLSVSAWVRDVFTASASTGLSDLFPWCQFLQF